MRTKALFWDFDGTLVVSNSLWSGSVYKAIGGDNNPYGITFQAVRPYMKSGYPWHSPEKDWTRCTGTAWWVYMEAFISGVYKQLGVDEEQARQAAGLVRGFILDSANYELYEDTFSTLEKCVELGYKNYILSNNYPELVETVRKLGLSPYFEGCVVSGIAGYDKPRKELFDFALQMAGYPDIAYMVGDNPVADIEGANRSGMIPVLVHCESDANTRYRFNNLKDILQIL